MRGGAEVRWDGGVRAGRRPGGRGERNVGVARRWAWLAVLVVGIALFEAVRRALITTGNPNLVPSLILLGAAVVPAAFVTFISERRLRYSISGGVVALIALIGGVVGVVAAGTLEFDTLQRLGVMPMLAVGVIEEGAKLIAPFVVLVVTRHRRPADGLLAGVAAGAGFAALETMGYGFVTLVQSGGNLAAVDGVLLLRGILSPAAHMAWTGLTAAALWRAAERHWRPRAIAGFVGVFVVAVALHTAWDSIGQTAGYVVIALLSLALLTFTTHRLAVADPDPAVAPRGA
jgi:RsiW-degrading membrane proteinase PrsW (M82 family)